MTSSFHKKSNAKKFGKYKPRVSMEESNIIYSVQANGMNFIGFMNGVPADGFGPGIVLLCRRVNNAYGGMPLDLTGYNHDELVAIKEVIDKTFALALPIAKARDEKAAEREQYEHIPLDRITRPIPRVIVSKRIINVDVQELLQRPADILDDDADGESE